MGIPDCPCQVMESATATDFKFSPEDSNPEWRYENNRHQKSMRKHTPAKWSWKIAAKEWQEKQHKKCTGWEVALGCSEKASEVQEQVPKSSDADTEKEKVVSQARCDDDCDTDTSINITTRTQSPSPTPSSSVDLQASSPCSSADNSYENIFLSCTWSELPEEMLSEGSPTIEHCSISDTGSFNTLGSQLSSTGSDDVVLPTVSNITNSAQQFIFHYHATSIDELRSTPVSQLDCKAIPSGITKRNQWKYDHVIHSPSGPFFVSQIKPDMNNLCPLNEQSRFKQVKPEVFPSSSQPIPVGIVLSERNLRKEEKGMGIHCMHPAEQGKLAWEKRQQLILSLRTQTYDSPSALKPLKLQKPYEVPLEGRPYTPPTRDNIPGRYSLDVENLKEKYIDTHCHLDFLFSRLRFEGPLSLFQETNASDFPSAYGGCIAIFCQPTTFHKVAMWKSLLEDENVWGAFGCHPRFAACYNDSTESFLRQALQHEKVVALGEIGLDYFSRYGDIVPEDLQKSVFKKQLAIARQFQLPLVIHCRDADQDCLEILKEELPREYRFHRHCFTGSWEEAKIWLDEFPNCFFGLTGLVTYQSATPVHNVAKKIPLDRLLLETDAPYFCPRQAAKEKRHSNPGMALHVAAQIAALRQTSLDEIICKTRQNTSKMKERIQSLLRERSANVKELNL
ncbi:unnamed protein product [Darwinula stevensoni]|uniref:Uncharacterized protein n=1 Tax=Darwinula stevensoni TaxID=69355 RepID=A0A7R8X0Z2_9CRUS|nr:unnamed protein product [Darwinula stevensoni]CAG0881719.1 unnamed protein product [Darwinula stevensoni]